VKLVAGAVRRLQPNCNAVERRPGRVRRINHQRSALSDTADTRREGIESGDEQDLGLQHVADSGHDTLIEQDVANRIGVVRADAACHFAAIERRIEKVGPERLQLFVTRELPGRQQLGDRHVEPDGHGVHRPDDHPHVARRALPARPGGIDVPAAVHPHVRVQDEGFVHRSRCPAPARK
jgi:hypothetical protein